MKEEWAKGEKEPGRPAQGCAQGEAEPQRPERHNAHAHVPPGGSPPLLRHLPSLRRLRGLSDATDLPLEVVILLVGGLALTLAGALLFSAASGALPWYENGLYGLLLFFFAVQIVTLGKTPFGDARRTKPLLALGIAVASVGIVTCFVPDLLGEMPRMLLALCLGPGGALLLLEMLFSREKCRAWLEQGGVLRRLVAAAGAVYALSILLGLLVWKKDLFATPLTALVALAFGGALFLLAFVLEKVYRLYPEAGIPRSGPGALPADRALLLLTGVFMVLLGVLLIPVNLGLLPFSGSAQLGLLMVLFALQMLAAGSTPVGAFPRSRFMIILGLLFAAPGIVSCIVPGVLVPFLTVLVGVCNILGGGLTLGKLCLSLLTARGAPHAPGTGISPDRGPDTGTSQGTDTSPAAETSPGTDASPDAGASPKAHLSAPGPVPPLLVKLTTTQVTMNLLSILFGTSMLVSGVIPGWILGPVLAANGGALLYLLHILTLLDRMRSGRADTPAA